jgi:hypothetical protein
MTDISLSVKYPLKLIASKTGWRKAMNPATSQQYTYNQISGTAYRGLFCRLPGIALRYGQAFRLAIT